MNAWKELYTHYTYYIGFVCVDNGILACFTANPFEYLLYFIKLYKDFDFVLFGLFNWFQVKKNNNTSEWVSEVYHVGRYRGVLL